MTKSLDPGSYPAAYLQMADAFEDGIKRRLLEFKSRAAMISTQLDLYGFIRAIKADGGAEHYPRFIRVRLLRAKKAPWVLRVVHADATLVGKGY